MKWIYLDDERSRPLGRDILIPDYDSVINLINIFNTENVEFAIDFDHDLGDPYFSGYSVAKYIVENGIPMCGFHIHSANPIGAKNIRQLLTHYGYREMN